jgi:TolB-like protein
MVRTDNGFHFYTESFNRTMQDILAFPDEISLIIAVGIR